MKDDGREEGHGESSVRPLIPMDVVQTQRREGDPTKYQCLALGRPVLVRRERHGYLVSVEREILEVLWRQDDQPNDMLHRYESGDLFAPSG